MIASSARPFARSLVVPCLVVPCLALAVAMNGGATGALANGATAQATKPFEPQVGQEGKDVIWVPTAQTLVDKMLDMAKVTPNDYVIDLGSGDGRTVITAAKRGAKALGIEFNPNMVEVSRKNAEKEGVTGKATFTQGDIFETDFSSATVLTMFLLPSLNIKLRPTILDMKPGTRVVANSFDMGDWTPDETAQVGNDCSSHCKGFFWVVPAKVDGAWKMGDGELALQQTYQMVSGTMKNGNVIAPITDGKLNGEQIAFTAGGTQYTGKVSGNVIEGTGGSGGTWKATR